MAARHHQHRLKNLKAPVDWELLEKVGDGTFGSVYKLRSTRSGQLAAVKVVDCSHEKTRDEIFPELDILKKFSNHPNIVQFLGAYKYKSRTQGDQLWLVMELCRGGSVTALVKRLIRQNSFLNEDLIAFIAHEALKGLEVLHEKGVMHRDVKGANILLTSNAGVKLVDFGISTQLSHDEVRKHSSVGTPYWMSPEVIACDQQLEYSYDKRCDVWSLGITAIELADGSPPLSDEHPMRALFKIPRNPPPTVKNASKWSAELNDFVSKCVIKDFERRPFVHEVLQHKFVTWVPHKKRELQQMLKNIMTTQYEGKDGVDCDNSWCLSPIGARRDKWRDRKMLGVDDLVTLNNLTEETILTHVMERYLGDQIYTYIGDILIAVNPFKNLPIYDLKHSLMYRNLEKQSAAPHIFAIAASGYRSMLINQHQQCCLISGESGAGKTVSSNFLVQQLAELGKSGNRKLENKILQVNPLMEAIGNAQTGINDNSSRFGKYLELHFTSNGSIIGACLTEYLLEKSRVVSQSEEERNFHVFYYFLAGLWQDGELAKYSLKVKGRYKYLQTGNKSLEEVVFTTENKQRYDEFKTALKIIGFTQEEMSKLFSIIAAIIHIGDIDFIEDHSDLHMAENSKVNNFQQLQIIASLLRVSARDLCDALTTSSNVTRGETISRKNTVEQSLDCRDAMAKALYGALFTWIVDKINQLLFSESERQSKEFTIGILDIFGFENVHSNSFEQLFINIANEQIQYYFNQYIFTMEMNEYQKEGIPTSQIIIKDNKHMLDLFLQRPMGLLALLDEESGFPKATDATLIDKFNSNIYSDCYTKRREVTISFSIKHYAGEVVYDARGFLKKNRDTMSPDIIHVLRTSENTLLRTFFSQNISRNDFQSRRLHTAPYQATIPKKNGSKDTKSMLVVSLPGGRSTNSVSRRQQTLSMTFRSSLEDLLYRLTKADPHFVRCIKPNDRKMANQFDQERVMTQLRYTGVLETTRLRKEGYSERITFQEFVRRYQLVLFHLKEKVRPDALSCKAILRAAGLDHWLVGKTKIFLKYHHVEKLATILEKYRHSVILVQRAVRAWLQRRRFKHILDKRSRSAIVLQKVYRGRLVRKKYGHMINKRQKSATIIQSAVRRWLAVTKYKKIKRKREKSATKIQATYRGYRVKKVVQRELEIRRQIERDKQETAAKKITAVARGFQGRKEYGRRKEHSSQQETKMIYFFQQVSFLCHEFYGKQRNINTPVPVERRYIEEYKELVGPPRYEQYDQKNNNVPRETRHKEEGTNKHNKKSIETSHTDVYKGRVEVKHTSVEESSKPYKKAESRLKVAPPSPQRKFINTRSEIRGERGPVVRKNSQVYKANPLIAEALQQQRETLHSHRQDSEDSFVIDTSQMTYSYRAPEKLTGNESWRSSDPRSTSSNVLLVRQSSNMSYTKRRKYQERRKGNQGESTAGHHGIKTEPSVLSDLTTVGEPLGSGVTEIPCTDLRAKLRKTGQIEQTSGLHKIEIARKHSQRVIDVN